MSKQATSFDPEDAETLRPDFVDDFPEPYVTLTALEAQAAELKTERAGVEGQRAQIIGLLREADAKLLSYDGAQEIVARLIKAAKGESANPTAVEDVA